MAVEFKLPDLGENIESGDVLNVLVKEGDQVQAEQGVVEIETGKAVVEVPCPTAGKVTRVHVKKGDKLAVGALVLTLEAAAVEKPQQPAKSVPGPAAPARPEASKGPPNQPAPAKPAAAPERRAETRPAERLPTPAAEPRQSAPAERKPAPRPAPAAGNGSQRDPVPAAPATRRLARELGIDLRDVSGSGPGGRITREDVMTAVRESNQPTEAEPRASAGRASAVLPEGVDGEDDWGPVRRAHLTKIRQVIAANMARSHSTIPHVTNFDDADITELERIRKGSMADFVGQNVKLTTMAFILKAVAQALKLHPAINASLDLEQDEVIYKEYINVGVAVDTERGLVVPAMRGVDRLSIPQIAQELAALAERARGGKFTLDDLRGGTFTISNLGAIGGTYSTPIINPPEVAVLLVGRARMLPVVLGEKIEPRLMCPLSLSYDHRWVDGAVAGRFLNEIKSYLEAPARLLLAP